MIFALDKQSYTIHLIVPQPYTIYNPRFSRKVEISQIIMHFGASHSHAIENVSLIHPAYDMTLHFPLPRKKQLQNRGIYTIIFIIAEKEKPASWGFGRLKGYICFYFLLSFCSSFFGICPTMHRGTFDRGKTGTAIPAAIPLRRGSV